MVEDVILKDDGNDNQDDKGTYVDIPDHVYDRTFKTQAISKPTAQLISYDFGAEIQALIKYFKSIHLICRILLIYSLTSSAFLHYFFIATVTILTLRGNYCNCLLCFRVFTYFFKNLIDIKTVKRGSNNVS